MADIFQRAQVVQPENKQKKKKVRGRPQHNPARLNARKITRKLVRYCYYCNYYQGRIKRKGAFVHAQNIRIHIILRMRKVPSGHLLSIETFFSIKQFCLRTVKAQIRLRGCAGWSGPSLSAYAHRHVFAWRGPSLEQTDLSICFEFLQGFSDWPFHLVGVIRLFSGRYRPLQIQLCRRTSEPRTSFITDHMQDKL